MQFSCSSYTDSEKGDPSLERKNLLSWLPSCQSKTAAFAVCLLCISIGLLVLLGSTWLAGRLAEGSCQPNGLVSLCLDWLHRSHKVPGTRARVRHATFIQSLRLVFGTGEILAYLEAPFGGLKGGRCIGEEENEDLRHLRYQRLLTGKVF
mgnify:CR=1 FL=1|jgi:hypothetical protein